MGNRRLLLALALTVSCADDDAESDTQGSDAASSAGTTSSSETTGEGSSSTAPVDPPEPGTFTALTYNVAGLPQGISSSEPEANMPLISPLLNGFDLVLVQEDFWYHAELTAQVQHPHVSVPWPEQLQAFIGDGLNRFSQFPFEPVERVPWFACNGQLDCSSDCLATKGWSFARTTVAPGVEIDVYNLHMEAGSCPEDLEIRQQASMDLVAAIVERSVDRAVIVGGDYNLRYSDPEDLEPLATIMQGASLRDVCDEVTCEGQDIDHFMIRDGATLRLEPVRWWEAPEFGEESDGTALSDHPAVAVELRYVPQ